MNNFEKDFDDFKKKVLKQIEEQHKIIKLLQTEIKKLTKERQEIIVYVNNLMKKADNVIKQNHQSLRRTQVIDRQKIEELNQEVANISRHIK